MATQQELSRLNDIIQKFDQYKATELLKTSYQIDLEHAKLKYERVDEQIKRSINSTGQQQSNVSIFLKLNHELLGSIMANIANQNKLSIEAVTFGEYISREYNDKLRIEWYFNDNRLERFVPIFHKEGFIYLDELTCKNEDEYQDMVTLIKKSLEKDNDDNNQDNSFNKRELRMLKRICLRPELWQSYQAERTKATKSGMMIVSPLLRDFFSRMNTAIQLSEQLLTYDTPLNNQQIKAINDAYNMAPINNKNDDIKDNDDKDYYEPQLPHDNTLCYDEHARKQWHINSNVQIYSDSNKKWFNGEIINITNDNEGEWLHVKYTANSDIKIKQIQRGSTAIRSIILKSSYHFECRALVEASISNINVTDSMLDEFNKSTITARVLTIARGFEEISMMIVKSQGTVRQSVLLAQEILKLRPAFITDGAKKLWTALDDCIMCIFEYASEMAQMYSTYYNFCLKFEQSFGYYVSINKCNPNISLFISLQHVRKDTKDFNKFTKQLEISKLNEAMELIKNCVCYQMGAANFQKHEHQLELLRVQYLDKKKIYDQRAMELDAELTEYKNDRDKLLNRLAASKK